MCEAAFTALKEYLASTPLLSRPTVGEPLFLYLSVSRTAVSSILVRSHDKEDLPVDYTSKSLKDTEIRYPGIEQLTLALLVPAKRLRPYFQSHPIIVLTDHPLRFIMQRPETSKRLTKWSIELSEFDITYRPRPAIKAQVLADFISEFTTNRDSQSLPTLVAQQDGASATAEMPRPDPYLPVWQLNVDGASNKHPCHPPHRLFRHIPFRDRPQIQLPSFE